MSTNRTIPSNTATATLRRVPFRLVDATDLVTPEDVTVTGVKASLSINGGTPANSTNDIVKVDGATGRYYIELTQSEANQTAGALIEIRIAPTGCAPAYVFAEIGPAGVFDATVAVGSIATDAINAAAIAADAVAEIQSGLATASALATVQADTDNLQTRLPAALVGGRIDASVGAVANDAITAAALAADVATEIAAAIFARQYNAEMNSLTFEQLTGLIGAVLLGKASGLNTTTATFRNLQDNANAVVATVDADGNRSAVTLTPAAVS